MQPPIIAHISGSAEIRSTGSVQRSGEGRGRRRDESTGLRL